jgi:uncharacterized coiled-coil DUF342 family protein
MEELNMLREMCEKKNEKEDKLKKECVEMRGEIEDMNYVIKESEECKKKMKKKIYEKDKEKKKMRIIMEE